MQGLSVSVKLGTGVIYVVPFFPRDCRENSCGVNDGVMLKKEQRFPLVPVTLAPLGSPRESLPWELLAPAFLELSP